MNKRFPQYISKLWKITPFYLFSLLSKQQNQTIEHHLQTLLNSYNHFEQTILFNFQQLKSIPTNIPILVHIKNELTKTKIKIQKFIKQQSNNITSIINTLTQFKLILKNSQIQATNEYTEHLNYYFSTKYQKISYKKLQKIHEQLLNLQYLQKLSLLSKTSNFHIQNWLLDFSIRSEDFFMKIYSVDWIHHNIDANHANQKPFYLPISQNQINSLMFKVTTLRPTPTSNHTQKQSPKLFQLRVQTFMNNPNIVVHYQKDIQLQQDYQNDIVSQIYKELQFGDKSIYHLD